MEVTDWELSAWPHCGRAGLMRGRVLGVGVLAGGRGWGALDGVRGVGSRGEPE